MHIDHAHSKEGINDEYKMFQSNPIAKTYKNFIAHNYNTELEKAKSGQYATNNNYEGNKQKQLLRRGWHTDTQRYT